MCVNNLPKVATQWNSGATRDSNRGLSISQVVLNPSALTTRPPNHTHTVKTAANSPIYCHDLLEELPVVTVEEVDRLIRSLPVKSSPVDLWLRTDHPGQKDVERHQVIFHA